MRVGVLTGGGDCPGLNAVIRAVVRKGIARYRQEFIGFRDGWRGPLEGDGFALDVKSVRGILPRGGTILGSSRTNPLKVEGGVERIEESLRNFKVDALVAIGGEDTLGVATALHEHGVPIVGVPKTIDNDLNATDYTFGFDTAVNIAMEAIDRLHTTAESHRRVLVVEVMGRHAGSQSGHHARELVPRNDRPRARSAVRQRRGGRPLELGGRNARGVHCDQDLARTRGRSKRLLVDQRLGTRPVQADGLHPKKTSASA